MQQIKYTFYILLLFSAFCSAATRQDMVLILEKTAKVNKTLTSEKPQWDAERKTLELELELLKSAISEKKKSTEEIQAIISDYKKKKEALTETLKKLQDKIASIDKSTDKQVTSLLSFSKALPSALQKLIKNEINSLKSFNSSPDSDLFDKLSAIRNFTQATLEIQKKTHRLQEVITINNQEKEVTAIYIGTSLGYFVNKAFTTAGKIVPKEKSWQAVEDKALIQPLKVALEQMNRDGAPTLVQLPVRGVEK